MHLRSRRVRVQIVIVPLVCLAHIMTPQELSSARAQGNCQGKNFLIPKASQTKRVGTRGWTEWGHDQHWPSNGCQITHTTYKYFHGHNSSSYCNSRIWQIFLMLNNTV